jgi:hypothetical protein
VRAAPTIRKGDELTLNYLGLLRIYKERKEQLKGKWFFIVIVKSAVFLRKRGRRTI